MTAPSPQPAAGPEPNGRAGTTLQQLVVALGTELVEVVDAPSGRDVVIASVAIVDDSDTEIDLASPISDLNLHVGVPTAQALRWFTEVGRRPAATRPVAVMTKNATTSPELRQAARRAGVALVAVHPHARWDHVFPLVQRVLDRSRPGSLVDTDVMATDTDLFELAQIVAQNTGGLVSIEDDRSQVLAYSATDESADELRTLSILGREGPADYLRVLQEWGVFDRLRRSADVVAVQARPELGIKARLVVGIREPADESTGQTGFLGSIWVQQGDRPFAEDAVDVLRGASAMAARTIARSRNAPSTENLLIHRMFGARGGGVDVPSLAGALNLPATGPAAVIGLAVQPGTDRVPPPTTGAAIAAVGAVLRLQASAFRPDSLSTIIGERAYILLPRYPSAAVVTTWTRQLVDQFETRHSLPLRAGIAAPVADLGQVAAARAEVDRVLDGTVDTFPHGRVTTLAESLTAVLLGEILDLVHRHPDLADPRLDALADYDRTHTTQLTDSLQAYLDAHGDVAAAAAALQVHQNTVRYRVRRAADILSIDLADPSDRLLLELQLARRKRAGG